MKPLHISFLLDETGSMTHGKDETIKGFNSYIQELKNKTEDVTFTLVKFDSEHYTVVHDKVPVKDVAPLNNDTYTPGAMTPLVDAAYRLISQTKAKGADKVVVILTDGMENASLEHKSSDLKELIDKKQAKGWKFIFLGADIDAFAQATQLGFKVSTTLSYGKKHSAAMFRGIAGQTVSYASTRLDSSLDFSDEQREETAQ